MVTRENRSTRRKTCLSAALATTNPTWTVLILHLGLHEERHATGRLHLGSRRRSVLRYTTQQLYHRDIEPSTNQMRVLVGLRSDPGVTENRRFGPTGNRTLIVLRYTAQQLYHRGHRTRYQSDGSLGGSEIRSGRH